MLETVIRMKLEDYEVDPYEKFIELNLSNLGNVIENTKKYYFKKVAGFGLKLLEILSTGNQKSTQVIILLSFLIFFKYLIFPNFSFCLNLVFWRF